MFRRYQGAFGCHAKNGCCPPKPVLCQNGVFRGMAMFGSHFQVCQNQFLCAKNGFTKNDLANCTTSRTNNSVCNWTGLIRATRLSVGDPIHHSSPFLEALPVSPDYLALGPHLRVPGKLVPDSQVEHR